MKQRFHLLLALSLVDAKHVSAAFGGPQGDQHARILLLLQARQVPAGVPLQPVDETPFTQVNPKDYRPVFRSAAVRDDFNVGLRQLKTSGRFQAIYDRYLRA